MLLTSSVQNNLSRSHENSPTKPDIINTPALLYLAVISRDLCEKKRTSKHTFSPNVEKGGKPLRCLSELELPLVHLHTQGPRAL